MDNRIFNVNGKGDELLLATLKLVFSQVNTRTTCSGWVSSVKHGLILLWFVGSNAEDAHANKLPSDMSAEEIFPMVKSWLKGKEAQNVLASIDPKKDRWDHNCDHDGHNTTGWRIYCEDWGRIEGFASICAIKPVFLWHGK